MKLKYIIPMIFLLLITSVSASVTEDIPISKGIAEDTNYAFDWRLDDADLVHFMDTQILFQGKEYDIHDELILRKDSPSIETSLTSSDDDYEDNIFLEAKKKSIYYMLMVDDTDLNISKATEHEPFKVNFLGKELEIINVPDGYDDRFTAIVGERFYMYVGDVVNVDGKQITLVNVGAGGQVEVDVDGYQEMINWGSVRLVGGIEIYLRETFYDMDMNNRAAVMYIGNPAVKTYRNNDPYIGEDEARPQWKWTIGNLGSEGDTIINTTAIEENMISVESGPYIGIYNNFRKTSDTDNPAGVGECYYLPNNYAEICLDSLNVPTTDYLDVSMEYVNDAPLDESGYPGMTSAEKAIYIHAPGNDRFTLEDGTQTSEIWLTMISESEVGIFYRAKEQVPDIQHLKNIDISTEQDFLRINYQDTMDNNIIFKAIKTSLENFQIRLDVNGDSILELSDSTDDLITNWSISSSEFVGLGLTQGLEEAGELMWNREDPFPYEIGEKDENHRTKYGISIKDPKSNGASDQVVLGIPGDQVQANVIIRSNPVPEPIVEPEFVLLGPWEWNLFSIPVTQQDTTTETVISDIQSNVDVIYGYENGQWKVWRNSYPSNTLTNINAGKGYFAKLIGDQPALLTYSGTIGAGDPPVIPTFNVYSGWNLIGYYGTTDVSAHNALINIDGKYSAIWTLFDEFNMQSWQGSFEGLNFNEPLKRTHGYWLYMQEDGIIVPTN